MRCRHAAGGLIGTMLAAMAVVAAIIGFMVVIAAVVAYLKRETWTLPAYRRTRDRTGRWSVTPWSSREPGDAVWESEPPDEAAEPAP